MGGIRGTVGLVGIGVGSLLAYSKMYRKNQMVAWPCQLRITCHSQVLVKDKIGLCNEVVTHLVSDRRTWLQMARESRRGQIRSK